MAWATVLLAEDHAIVAEGLEALLRDRFKLVGTVHDGRALLEAVSQLNPDVIVTDISMPALNGLDAVRQIKRERPDVKVVILTVHADVEMAAEAFRAGAAAYLLKLSSGEELVMAIEEVLRGGAYLSPRISRDLRAVTMQARGRPNAWRSKITPRQREVLQLIAEGRTMKEIAGILGISTRTAETHKYAMMEALGIKTTAELIQYAVRLKLVSC